jgi:hypothetical protein
MAIEDGKEPAWTEAPLPQNATTDQSVTEILKDPPQYLKAIVGGVLAALTAAATAAVNGFTVPEVIGIAVAGVSTFAGVFFTTNQEGGE